MSRGLRVGLVGAVGGGNTGNEVSLAVVRDLIHGAREDLQFAVVTPTPHEARARSIARPEEPVVALRAPRPPRRPRSLARLVRRGTGETLHVVRVVRAVGDLRALVVCGTGILDDFEEPPWGMPWSFFLWAAVARARGVPFVLMAVGAGPITGRLSQVLFRATVQLATEVTYRDEDSLRTMETLGARRDDARVTCDLAFGRSVPPAPVAVPGPTMRVGVAVMDWGGWSKRDETTARIHRSTLVGTVDGLMAQGHRVLLLVGQPVDVEPAREIRRRVLAGRPDQDLPVADIETFDDLVAAVQTTDLVLATRFHTVVAALLTDRPVISAGYAPKNHALLARVGLAGADRPVKDVDATWWLDRVEAVATGRDEARASGRIIGDWAELVRDELADLATRIG